MRVTAIVLAAGKGARFRSVLPKLLVRIGRRPLIAWSLAVFQRHPAVKDIIIVVNASLTAPVRRLVRASRIAKVRAIVCGGKRRQDSVRQGLGAAACESDIVLIHDGARPFVSRAMISSVIRTARQHGAAVVGVPVKATIKETRVTSRKLQVTSVIVKRTLDRKRLWEIQTPQAFRKAILEKAFKRFGAGDVTDDAALVEKLGVAVRIVPGCYSNIKVTTREDASFARALVKERAVWQRHG